MGFHLPLTCQPEKLLEFYVRPGIFGMITDKSIHAGFDTVTAISCTS